MCSPSEIWIYHIIHLDKLPFILADEGLLCDAEVTKRQRGGTCIGFNHIKQRRLNELKLKSHTNLYVGDCVPFYFCPRSIMLFIIHKNNFELTYKNGQKHIVHLVANFHETVCWANKNNKRWAFTTSNAGSYYADDYADLEQLNKIDWDAVNSVSWKTCKEHKQAEFLLECYFPWFLVKEIGVYSYCVEQQVISILNNNKHIPQVKVKVKKEWYY